MDSKLLAEAKKDIPLYKADFQAFWEASNNHFKDKDLTDCYATTLIFKNWKICLNHIKINSLDGLLQELHEDINAAFFHAFYGNYRSSHMHLRSIIELSLQLIYFYQHEVEYALWHNADFRIKHEELTNYLKKHPNLNSSDTIILIETITRNWKLFSKYIHAESPIYFQTTLKSNKTKKISRKDFGVWKSNFLHTGYYINKLILIFFKKHLNTFPTTNREILLRNMKSEDLKKLGMK